MTILKKPNKSAVNDFSNVFDSLQLGNVIVGPDNIVILDPSQTEGGVMITAEGVVLAGETLAAVPKTQTIEHLVEVDSSSGSLDIPFTIDIDDFLFVPTTISGALMGIYLRYGDAADDYERHQITGAQGQLTQLTLSDGQISGLVRAHWYEKGKGHPYRGHIRLAITGTNF